MEQAPQPIAGHLQGYTALSIPDHVMQAPFRQLHHHIAAFWTYPMLVSNKNASMAAVQACKLLDPYDVHRGLLDLQLLCTPERTRRLIKAGQLP